MLLASPSWHSLLQTWALHWCSQWGPQFDRRRSNPSNNGEHSRTAKHHHERKKSQQNQRLKDANDQHSTFMSQVCQCRTLCPFYITFRSGPRGTNQCIYLTEHERPNEEYWLLTVFTVWETGQHLSATAFPPSSNVRFLHPLSNLCLRGRKHRQAPGNKLFFQVSHQVH